MRTLVTLAFGIRVLLIFEIYLVILISFFLNSKLKKQKPNNLKLTKN